MSFTALYFVLMQVRVATEGINGTVGGTQTATSLYIKAMLAHPIFQEMHVEDFKVNKQKYNRLYIAEYSYTKWQAEFINKMYFRLVKEVHSAFLILRLACIKKSSQWV